VTRRTTPAPAPERDERLCALDDCTRPRWGDDPLCRRHLAELEQAMTVPESPPTTPEPAPTAPVE
jgi:hypothetical protein